MPILFFSESGEIQDSLTSQLRLQRRGGFGTCPLEAAASPGYDLPNDVDLIIIGVQQRDQGEIVGSILAKAAARNQIPVVVVARDPSGAQVLNWLQRGASAVELWPCQPSRIAFLVDYLTAGCPLNRPPRDVQSTRQPTTTQRGGIVSASPSMQRLIDQIERVAPLDANVLLSGETGVGKTRLARLLHDRSQKGDVPFCAVNCGALPESLIESELFGHRPGAFTGADSIRKGRFEEVGQGTLFLDEVDSIPISSQCKLLRAIENRVFEPLGSNRSITFRGRIVAASNAQLERLIEQGQFRADLFYRLGVVDLQIPPLRERRDDIRPIAEAALREYADRNKLRARSIGQDVVDLLEVYPWPGNIRQLRNVIESSASLCCGEQIELADLSGRWVAEARSCIARAGQGNSRRVPATVEFAKDISTIEPSRFSLAERRAKLEAEEITTALLAVRNNRTKAAIQLGISRTMLYKKIAKYGLADVC